MTEQRYFLECIKTTSKDFVPCACKKIKSRMTDGQRAFLRGLKRRDLGVGRIWCLAPSAGVSWSLADVGQAGYQAVFTA